MLLLTSARAAGVLPCLAIGLRVECLVLRAEVSGSGDKGIQGPGLLRAKLAQRLAQILSKDLVRDL